jgi:hypothetical protein
MSSLSITLAALQTKSSHTTSTASYQVLTCHNNPYHYQRIQLNKVENR